MEAEENKRRIEIILTTHALGDSKRIILEVYQEKKSHRERARNSKRSTTSDAKVKTQTKNPIRRDKRLESDLVEQPKSRKEQKPKKNPLGTEVPHDPRSLLAPGPSLS